jgi:hypothetical protein
MRRPTFRRLLEPQIGESAAPPSTPLGHYPYGTTTGSWGPNTELFALWGAVRSQRWAGGGGSSGANWGTVGNGTDHRWSHYAPHYFGASGVIRKVRTWTSLYNSNAGKVSFGFFSNVQSDSRLWPSKLIHEIHGTFTEISGFLTHATEIEVEADRVYWLGVAWNGVGGISGYMCLEGSIHSPGLYGGRRLSNFWNTTEEADWQGLSIYIGPGGSGGRHGDIVEASNANHKPMRTMANGNAPRIPTCGFVFEAT